MYIRYDRNEIEYVLYGQGQRHLAADRRVQVARQDQLAAGAVYLQALGQQTTLVYEWEGGSDTGVYLC